MTIRIRNSWSIPAVGILPRGGETTGFTVSITIGLCQVKATKIPEIGCCHLLDF